MSIVVIEHVLALAPACISAAERAVLLALADRVGDDGSLAFMSYATIAASTSLAERSVARNLRALQAPRKEARDLAFVLRVADATPNRPASYAVCVAALVANRGSHYNPRARVDRLSTLDVLEGGSSVREGGSSVYERVDPLSTSKGRTVRTEPLYEPCSARFAATDNLKPEGKDQKALMEEETDRLLHDVQRLSEPSTIEPLLSNAREIQKRSRSTDTARAIAIDADVRRQLRERFRSRDALRAEVDRLQQLGTKERTA